MEKEETGSCGKDVNTGGHLFSRIGSTGSEGNWPILNGRQECRPITLRAMFNNPQLALCQMDWWNISHHFR